MADEATNQIPTVSSSSSEHYVSDSPSVFTIALQIDFVGPCLLNDDLRQKVLCQCTRHVHCGATTVQTKDSRGQEFRDRAVAAACEHPKQDCSLTVPAALANVTLVATRT